MNSKDAIVQQMQTNLQTFDDQERQKATTFK